MKNRINETTQEYIDPEMLRHPTSQAFLLEVLCHLEPRTFEYGEFIFV